MTRSRPIVLASRSPRRLQLLQQAGWMVTVEVPSIDDGVLHAGDSTPEEWVEALAWMKTRAVADARVERGDDTACTILGADTVCVLGDLILGQPDDCDEARSMLQSFIGRAHDVMTGICLFAYPEGTRRMFFDCAEVIWGEVSQEAIETYLDGNGWRGKAGAYNLEDRLEDGWPIQCLGDPTTVMGLPMQRLKMMFSEMADH